MRSFLLTVSCCLSTILSFSQSITCSVPSNFFVCPGATFKVKYQATGNFTNGNVFSAELNNYQGKSVIVGSLVTTSDSDSITINIPTDLIGSFNLRINASSPSVKGTNSSSSISIGTPSFPGLANYNQDVCSGNKLHLYLIGAGGVEKYVTWQGPNDFIAKGRVVSINNVNSDNAGEYSVRIEYYGGCTGPEVKLNVAIKPDQAPPVPIISNNSPVCTGDTLYLTTTSANVEFEWLGSQGEKISESQSVFYPTTYSTSGIEIFKLRTIAANGCYSDTAYSNVTIKSKATLSDVVVNNNVDLACKGTSIYMSAYSSSSFADSYWTAPNGEKIKGTGATFIANTSGKYKFTGENYNGCLTTYSSHDVIVDDANPTSYQTGTFQWAVPIKGKNGIEYPRGIKRDQYGNIILVSLASSDHTKMSPNDSLQSLGGYDIIVAKYDSTGKYIWGQRMGSSSDDYIFNGIELDPIGNVFIYGTFSGATAQFGNKTLNKIGSNSNLFFAKMDNDGNMLWIKQGNISEGNASYVNLTIDQQGNSYLFLPYRGNKVVDGLPLTDPAILKFGPDGSLIFNTTTPNYLSGIPLGELTTDNDQNCYITTTLNSYGDPVLLKISPSGNILFNKTYTSLRASGESSKTNVTGFQDLVFTQDKYLYMAIPIHNKYKVKQADADPAYYIMLVKFDLEGNVIWKKPINESSRIISLDSDALGNIYLTGSMSGKFACSNVALANSYGAHSFISKYNNDGTWDWTKSITAENPSLKVSPQGDIYFAAINSTNTKLDTILLNNSGHMFLGKIGAPVHVMTGLNNKYCVGENLSLNFTTKFSYLPGNKFNVELSDAKGRFINPVTIGIATSVTGGSVNCQIPLDIQNSNKYRIRITSTNPVHIGENNGFDISLSRPTITVGTIDKTTICGTTIVKVPFKISECGFYIGNIFKAQLSDVNGAFTYPIEIGSLVTSLKSDTILATIPDTLTFGSKYQIRVVGSVPHIAGQISPSTITIYGKPVITSESNNYCENESLKLSAASASTATYQWSGPNNFSSTLANPTIALLTKANEGIYKVTTNIGTCKATEASLFIKVNGQEALDSLSWNWAKNYGKRAASQFIDLKAGDNGFIYTFSKVTSADTVDGFSMAKGLGLVKKDTLGNTVWAKTLITSSMDNKLLGKEMLIDDKGQIYLLGTFQQDLISQNGSLTPFGTVDVFLAKVSDAGNMEWIYNLGGQNNSEAGNMNFDKDNNIFLLGTYYITPGNSELKFLNANGMKKVTDENSGTRYYVTSYSPQGNFLSYKAFKFDNDGANSQGAPNFLYLNIDRNNNYILNGTFVSTFPLDSSLTDSVRIRMNFYPSGRSDGFIAKYDPSWKLQWSRVIGGFEFDGTNLTKSDKYGNIYLLVNYDGYNGFPILIPSGNNYIGYSSRMNYLIKYNNLGTLQWIKNVGYESIMDVAISDEGDTYISKINSYVNGSPSFWTGCNTYNTSGKDAAFVQMINRDGKLSFIEYASTLKSSRVRLSNVAINKSGHIFLSGSYDSDADFDKIKLTGASNFIARLDKSGSIPIAEFSFIQKCFPDSIEFLNNSNGDDIVSYLWDFGDPLSGENNVSTIINPKHKFSGRGAYVVKLTVTNSAGKKNTYTRTIEIKEKAIVTITGERSVCTYKRLNLKATAANYGENEVKWNWDVSKIIYNVTGPSNTASLTVDFIEPQTFDLKLFTEAAGCKDTVHYPIKVLPSTSIGISVSNPCLHDSVVFDLYNYRPDIAVVKSHWNFGDGKLSPSVNYLQESIKHYYNTGDKYTIRVIFENEFGCKDSAYTQEYISKPYADYSITGPCLNSSSNLKDLSLNFNGRSFSSRTWIYNPGNNIISTEEQVNYIFTSPGSQSIDLVVTDNYGCSSKISKSFEVSAKPVISEEANILSTGSYLTYEWFANGESINEATDRFYTAEKLALYNVKVTDQYGCVLVSDVYENKGIVSSINASGKGSMNIFPNPTSDIFYISLKDFEQNSYEVELINELGVSVYKQEARLQYTGQLIEINTETITAGSYLIKIKSDKEFHSGKLTIVK